MRTAIKKLWQRAFGPKLRCRPGDLCIVIGRDTRYAPVTGEAFTVPYRMGLIVQVVSHDGVCWTLKDPIAHTYVLRCGFLTTVIYGIADELLQPLPRDPDPAAEVAAPAPPIKARRPADVAL